MSTTQTTENSTAYDVVILGAGYAGLMAAVRLGRRKLQLRVALVNPLDQFVERVRLQESLMVPVVPRIASISAFLEGTTVDFICGTVTVLRAEQGRVRIVTATQEMEIGFSQAIYALGSHVDVDGVPGAAEHAYRLDPGEGPRSAAALRTRLHQATDRPQRIVAVGGGPLATEVAGEIKTGWPDAELTMVSERCCAFAGPRVEKAVRAELGRLGVQLIDGETVSEVRPTEIMTEAGRSIPYDICVWSAGMRASPIAHAAGLATDKQGRIFVGPNLRSISHPNVFAVGDAGHPIAPTGAPYRLSALAAGASGAYAGNVIVAHKAKRPILPFSFSTFAQAVAIGRFGVFYPLSSNDKQILFILKGRAGRYVRDLLLSLVTLGYKLERKVPGAFLISLPGQHRVSWLEADAAMRKAPTGRAVPRPV